MPKILKKRGKKCPKYWKEAKKMPKILKRGEKCPKYWKEAKYAQNTNWKDGISKIAHISKRDHEIQKKKYEKNEKKMRKKNENMKKIWKKYNF